VLPKSTGTPTVPGDTVVIEENKTQTAVTNENTTPTFLITFLALRSSATKKDVINNPNVKSKLKKLM